MIMDAGIASAAMTGSVSTSAPDLHRRPRPHDNTSHEGRAWRLETLNDEARLSVVSEGKTLTEDDILDAKRTTFDVELTRLEGLAIPGRTKRDDRIQQKIDRLRQESPGSRITMTSGSRRAMATPHTPSSSSARTATRPPTMVPAPVSCTPAIPTGTPKPCCGHCGH